MRRLQNHRKRNYLLARRLFEETTLPPICLQWMESVAFDTAHAWFEFEVQKTRSWGVFFRLRLQAYLLYLGGGSWMPDRWLFSMQSQLAEMHMPTQRSTSSTIMPYLRRLPQGRTSTTWRVTARDVIPNMIWRLLETWNLHGLRTCNCLRRGIPQEQPSCDSV